MISSRFRVVAMIIKATGALGRGAKAMRHLRHSSGAYQGLEALLGCLSSSCLGSLSFQKSLIKAYALNHIGILRFDVRYIA